MTDPSGPQFVLSGGRYGTSSNDQGTYGYYWSSSAYTGATYAYYLYLRGATSAVGPAYNGGKRYAFSLRCLAQKSSVHLYKRRNNDLKILPSPPATPPENSNHSTTNIQPMIKCVSIQWGWCWEGCTYGIAA